MKKLFIFVAVLLCITSCTRRYKYVEVIREHQIFGGARIATKDEVTIRAKSDTAAYLEAYEKFCISKVVYFGMKERYGMPELLDYPIGFKLYNSKDIDISDIRFISKSEQQQIIEEKVMRAGVETFH